MDAIKGKGDFRCTDEGTRRTIALADLTVPGIRRMETHTVCLDPTFATTRRVTKEGAPGSSVPLACSVPSTGGGLRQLGYLKSSCANLPLVSIITVVHNGEKHLEETIRSVLYQNYDNIEYIVVDGGSTDGTMGIIRRYEHVIDRWISEPDKGIYDAMNKGISFARGDLVGILNADDWLCEGAVARVVSEYHRFAADSMLLITGYIRRVDEKGRKLFTLKSSEASLASSMDYEMTINHPATFLTGDVYRKLGVFDSRYKISGDYDLIYRLLKSKLVKFIFIKEEITCMRYGGVSVRINAVWTQVKENFIARKPYLGFSRNLWNASVIFTKLILKTSIRKITPTFIINRYYQIKHV